MHSSIGIESARLVWHLHPRLIVWSLLSVAMGCLANILVSDISHYLAYWIVLKTTAMPLIDTYVAGREWQDTISAIRRHLEREWGYTKFARATYTQRNAHTAQKFIQLKGQAFDAIAGMLNLVAWNGMSILCDASSCVVLLWKNPFWVSIGLACCVLVWVVLHSHHTRLIAENATVRAFINDIELDIRLVANMFQRGTIPAQELIDREDRGIERDRELGHAWNRYGFAKFGLLNLILVLVATFDDPLLAIIMFNDVIRATTGVMNFNTQMLRHQNQYAPYQELVHNQLSCAEQSDPHPAPSGLTIRSMQIHVPPNVINQKTQLRDGVKNVRKRAIVRSHRRIEFRAGETILIRGDSGSGKSTFLDGITAKLPGVQLSGGSQPAHIKHHFSEFYQTIKEDMPFQGMTIRRIFRGTPTDTIESAARICCIWTLVEMLGMDRTIVRKLSGGEKTRLALATALADCIVNRRPYFIGDEMEQGVDPHLAYHIIRNIRRRLCEDVLPGEPRRILIVVSHLERIADAFAWDQVLFLHNGNVCIAKQNAAI